MKLDAYQSRDRLVLTDAERIDAATFTGRWIRGPTVEVRA